MRIKLNKVFCLMAILALLCCGVALAKSNQQPVISIDDGGMITRGEYAKVNIVEPVSGEGIYYRAYILRDEGGGLVEENILADCWGGEDDLMLPTVRLDEHEPHNVYNVSVQAYTWDGENDVPVGDRSALEQITVNHPYETKIVLATNRGNSFDRPNDIRFGRDVEFSVYAPNAEKIFVCSNNDRWHYNGETVKDGWYSETDFTLQAIAFYENGTKRVESGVMVFQVNPPDGDMSNFGCWIEGGNTVVPREEFTVCFESSRPYPYDAHEVTYELNIWDMTRRGGEDVPEGDNFNYEEPVYSDRKQITNNDYVFTVPATWGDEDEWSIIAGHAYRVEVEARVDALYRSATAHTAFIAVMENPHEGVREFWINDGQDAQEIPCETDFEIRISAPNAIDIRVFNGEEYEYLSDREEWNETSDDEPEKEIGWSTHTGDIRYDRSHGWPTSFMLWAEAQYEQGGDWYRSNAVRVTIFSHGRINAPRDVDVDDTVTRGKYLPVILEGLDEHTEWVAAYLYHGDDTKDERVEEAHLETRGARDITIYVPTAKAEPGQYRLSVDYGAGGYQNNGFHKFLVVEPPENQEDIVLTFGKAPDEDDGKIHLEPHEELGISVLMPEGGENPRVALLYNGDENEWEDGNVMTCRYGSDDNGEVEIKAVGWLNYAEGAEPNYQSDPVKVVVYGEPLADIGVSVDPAVYPWREGTDAVDFSFDMVEDAESYYIRVENVSDENGYDVWKANIDNIEDWDRFSVEGDTVTYHVPVHYDNGNDVFDRDNLYNIYVSAFAYGRSTSDGEAHTVALVEPSDNMTMTVNEKTENATIPAHTTYRVRIVCEGADTFEFYDGDHWNEVHHRDGLNEGENEQVEDGDGVCEFNWDAGDSGTYALTCRVKTLNSEEPDEDWTQGPVVTLTVEGEEIEAPDLELFDIPETIKRGEDLVIHVPEQPGEHEGQQYGAHLIAANGEWLDYCHWDEEERTITIPTVAVEEGEYQVRVQTFAPGYDTDASYQDLTVVPGETGEVYIYMERDETETCENNYFSAYAPGAQRVRLLYRYDDGQEDEFWAEDGESVRIGESRGHSGEYRVCAEAIYEDGEPNQESKELTWRVVAPNGQLENVRIDAPPVIAPETEDLTFTVGEVSDGQFYSVRVWRRNGEDADENVFEKGYDYCPGEITVDHKAEDDEGEFHPVFHEGAYAVSVYVSARGYEDSYQEVRFAVASKQAVDISFVLMDEEGNEVDLDATNGSNEDAGLWTGRNYRLQVSGTSRATHVMLDRGEGDAPEDIDIAELEGAEGWTVTFPGNEEDWLNMGGGHHNLLVYAYDGVSEEPRVAGLGVTVQSHGRLAVPEIRIDEEDNTVVRGEYLHVHVDGVDCGEQYWAHIRGTYNREDREFFQTDNAIGDFVLPTAELDPTRFDWPADADVAYRVDVDVNAEGWDGNGNTARFNLAAREDEGDIVLTFSKAPDSEGEIHLEPHEELGISVLMPEGGDNPRVALLYNGDENEWEDDNVMTCRYGSDRNGEVEIKALGWLNYAKGAEPNYQSAPVNVRVYGTPLADIGVSVDPVVYPWKDDTQTVDFSFNMVEDAEWYYIRVENVSNENGHDVWEANIDNIEDWDRVSVAGDTVTYHVPVHYDDGNDVFERDNLYNIYVSAFAYGRSTSDGEAHTVALVEPSDNTTMTVNGEDESATATVPAHTTYRVRIECEGADTFEFYDGDHWNEVHHGDGLNEQEREQAGDDDGVCEFKWETGDSGTYALTCRVKTAETDPDWTQGPVVTLTVTGDEIDPPALDQFDIPETIKRGEDLVIRVPEGAVKEAGQQFGANLIAADGEWLGYYHWDEEESTITIPTVAVEEGDYQVRVQTYAPGYDNNASFWDLEVVSGEAGEVYIYMERDKTETCEDNTISAYAPGAKRVRLLCRDDNGNEDEFRAEDGESVRAENSRGHSGEYRVCAEACYADEDGGEDWFKWSEELTWRVYAPNGALDNVRIVVPPVITPDTDLTFTVGEVPNGQYYNVRVWTDGDDVFGKDYDGWPGGITVEHEAQDDEGVPYHVFHNGVYTVSAYVNARGFEDSYQEVRFLVTNNKAEGVSFRLLDEGGNEVSLDATNGSNEDAGLWTGRNYRVEISGSSQASSVEFNRGDGSEFDHIEIQDSDYDGDRWTVRYPENEEDWWNMSGGQYNLLVYVFDEEEMIGVAGRSVTVQSHGRLAVPNIEITDEDNTVVRGDYLHVHVDGVPYGQNYWAHIRGTYNGEEKDFYQTDNAIGDFVLPTAELHPTEVGWPAEAEVAYRVDVDVSAEGWDGNSNRARFNLRPKGDNEPVLAIAHDKDEEEDNKYYMWIDESLRASLCAPGAEHVWIEITGVCEGMYDTWSDNLALGQGEQDFHPNRPGMITVIGYAEYDGEETSRNTEPVDIEVSSLGRVGVPHIYAPETLGRDTDSLTFSFDYSELPGIPEEWDGWDDFEHNDHYAWQIQRSDNFNDWWDETDWTDVQHEGESSGDITFDRFEWQEGRVYRINVTAFADRCESNSDSYTVLCVSSTDENVTLEAKPGGDNPLDNLEQNEFVYLHITAPEGTENVDLFDGNGWFGISPKDGESWSDFTYDWRCHTGSYNLMVRAYYPDSEGGEAVVHAPSNPVYISAHSYGVLNRPEVAVRNENETVARGEFLDLEIGHVDNADDYDYRADLYRYDEAGYEEYPWVYVDGSYIDRLHVDRNQISTAGLEPGRYCIHVWATGIGWDDSDSAEAEFYVNAGKDPDQNGFVINVSNYAPETSETWKATVYYQGDELGWGALQLWLEDADRNPDNGFDLRSTTPNDLEASFSMGHAGTYKVCACVNVDGGEPINAEPVEVTVTAHGDLGITLQGMPEAVMLGEPDDDGEVRKLQSFSFDVTVDLRDSNADTFSLNVHDQYGTNLYTPEPIPVSDLDNGVATVPVTLEVDTTDYGAPTISAGTIIYVDAYVSAQGYNDAGDSRSFLVVDEEPEYDDRGFAISVTNAQPETGETWKATVICAQPNIQEGSLELWIEDSNGDRDDGFDGFVNEINTMRTASFNKGHSGEYTVHARVTTDDGEESRIFYADPVTVFVAAPEGPLQIAITEAPVTVGLLNPDESGNATLLEPFVVKVDVSQTAVEAFSLIVNDQGGTMLYTLDSIPVSEADEHGIVTVELNVDTYANDNWGPTISEKTIIYADAYVSAPGYDDAGDRWPIMVMGKDESPVKLELAEGEDINNMWAGQEFRMRVQAEGAMWAFFKDEYGSETSLNLDENGEAELTWCMGSGTHLMWVDAAYDAGGYDPTTNPDAWYGVSSLPLSIHFQCNGTLDAPEVTVTDHTVTRGEFLPVQIGGVYAGEDLAERYEVQVWKSEKGEDCLVMDGFNNPYSVSEISIPTGSLDPGVYYVRAAAFNARWDNTWSDRTDDSCFTVEDAEVGLVLTVSNTTPSTCEQWWVSAVYTGNPDCRIDIQVSKTDDPDYSVGALDHTWKDTAFDNGCTSEAAWIIDYAESYTVHAEVLDGNNRQVAYKEQEVKVNSPEGNLGITVADAPRNVSPDQDEMEVSVSVSEDVEQFSLWIEDPAGNWLYEQNGISTSDQVDGIVKVTVPLEFAKNDGDTFRVCVHTNRYGWSAAFDSLEFQVSYVLDEPEIEEPMPSVIKGNAINIFLTHIDARATTHATITGSNQLFEPEDNGFITIPTSQLNPGAYEIQVSSLKEGFENAIITRRVRVLDPNAKLTLPKAMLTIGEEAFAGTGAEIVEIPDGATTIEGKAFANSAVGYVIIPDSVTQIADDAFENCDCLVIECKYGSSAESYCARKEIYCNNYGE